MRDVLFGDVPGKPAVVAEFQSSRDDSSATVTRVMRTTISLEDRLAEAVRREAAARGMSVSALIVRIVDEALRRPEPTGAKPFRLVTVGGDGPRPGTDLGRPRESEAHDDEARHG